MKKILCIICFALSGTAVSAQATTARKEVTARQKKVQHQAEPAKKNPGKTKPATPVKREENAINTKDPGTDAVINSTTGGRNVPSTDTKSPTTSTTATSTTSTGSGNGQGTGSATRPSSNSKDGANGNKPSGGK